MTVSLNKLQEAVLDSYNALTQFLKDGDEDVEECSVKLDGHLLYKKMQALHNNLIWVLGIIDPETGEGHLDKEGVEINPYHFDE